MPQPPTESTPLQNALRRFQEFPPLVEWHDRFAGVSVGLAGLLALDALERASGGGGLVPAVSVGAYALCGMVGTAGSLFGRVWRQERERREREEAWAAEVGPEGYSLWDAILDDEAERLTQRYGVPFPPRDALDWMEHDVTALGADPVTCRIVLPLQGWRPWVLAIRTGEPERTRCTAYLERDGDHGPVMRGFVGGQVRTFPVVGAEFEPPCERGISLARVPPAEHDRLVVVVDVPPHTVARVRLYLTRPPGRHPDVEWEAQDAS